MARPELEITGGPLTRSAGSWVPPRPHRRPSWSSAACLDPLAKGYGLSESGRIDWDPLERADLPAPAVALIHHLCADGGAEVSADTLRDRLYKALLGLAQDRDARKTLNRNRPLTDVELLTLGQVYWNLEARGARTRLPHPARPDHENEQDGQPRRSRPTSGSRRRTRTSRP